MHRIDVSSATVDNKFTDGSPTGGVPATTVPAAWLNDLQENLSEAIEGAGIPLVKGDYTQLLDAIKALAFGILPKRVFAVQDYIRIPDEPGGLIVQFGSFNGVASPATPITVTLPTTFPNSIRAFVSFGAGDGTLRSVWRDAGAANNFTNSQVVVRTNVDSTTACFYIALGY